MVKIGPYITNFYITTKLQSYSLTNYSLSNSLSVPQSDSLSVSSSDVLVSKSSLIRFSILIFLVSYLHSSSVWG